MPRILHQQLSARFVETVRRPGLYLDGHGLYLQAVKSKATVGPKPKTLSKSWSLRYRFDGKVREMGLGPVRIVSLAEAREKAKECRRLLLEGIDPLEARKQDRRERALEAAKSITFSEAAEKFIASQAAAWKNGKHTEQWASTINTYCTPFLNAPVQAVDTSLVIKALEPIWTEKQETATRLRARIERVLDWAAVRGFRTGDNPARWKGYLDKLLPKIDKRKRVKHHAALPFREMGAFMEKVRSEDGLSARALEFTILTGARTGEVIGATWSEIDFANAVWTIPKHRMKASREHRVPLSPVAIKLLRSLERQGDSPGELVFALSNMSMLKLLERMGRTDITVHGFRSSFRDWAAETTNYPREVCEAALAHVVSGVEGDYRRGDLFEKRRRLMSEWARYCASPAKPKGEIIQLRKAKS